MPSLYGAHVSAAGGVFEAVTRSAEIKGTAFALFLKNEKRWVAKPYTPEVIEKFEQLCDEKGYKPRVDVLPHGSYLINLANPDESARVKSQEAFEDDLKRCELLQIGLYNLHPGSSLGSDRSTAIKNIAKGINEAHAKTSFVKVVLENMTGNDERIIGTRLEDLSAIIGNVKDKTRVGVCIDTCHSFAAGYDLRHEKAFNKFWADFDDIVGYQHLAGMHLNDSKGTFGSKRDLHQRLGLGFLGLETFRLVMNKKELEHVPKILETPHTSSGSADSREEEVELLKWLIGRSKDDKEVVEKAAVLSELGLAERTDFEKRFGTKSSTGKRQATLASFGLKKVQKMGDTD